MGTHRFSSELLKNEVQRRKPDAEAERLLRIDWQTGYWLELAALVAAAGMAGMIVAGRDQPGPRALDEDDRPLP